MIDAPLAPGAPNPAIKLRPYQEKFVGEIRTLLAKQRQIIGCAATGSGKTPVFISIAKAAIDKGRTVLIMSETRPIFAQIKKGLGATEIAAGSELTTVTRGALYLAMAQTLARRPALITQFAALDDNLLIIVDEAHISTPTKTLLQMPEALKIGFTATPSFKHAKHLTALYKGIVVGPQPNELVTTGFLSPYRHFARHRAELAGLTLKGGEFTEESQARIFETTRVYDGVIEDLKITPFKKCVIFTSSIKHCDALTERLRAANFTVSEVHYGLPDKQANYNLWQFTHGEINICISVAILTKGWDFPPIDLVVLNRATTSLPLYLQMIGRASRLSPGKTHFTVLDYGENYKRHKLWNYEHDWGTLWNKEPKKSKDGIAPVKECPQCEFLIASSVEVCPNCGFVFPKREPSEVETKLEEVTAGYRVLTGRKISELSPEELAIYAKFTNKKAFAIRVAKSNEQREQGWLAKFAAASEYKAGFSYFHLQQLDRDPTPIYFADITIR